MLESLVQNGWRIFDHAEIDIEFAQKDQIADIVRRKLHRRFGVLQCICLLPVFSQHQGNNEIRGGVIRVTAYKLFAARQASSRFPPCDSCAIRANS